MIKNRIYQLLAKTLNIDVETIKNCKPNFPLKELGFTSLLFVKLVIAIEEHFQIEIKDSDLLEQNFSSIEKIINVIEPYLSKTNNVIKKVIITDCDNVLWSGIAGEEKIYLSPINIEYQNKLLSFLNSGILLCLCSKNDYSNIYTAFSESNMILSLSSFISTRFNSNNKAEDIESIASELNISLSSIVFVDDDPHEIYLVTNLISDISAIQAIDSNDNWINFLYDIFSECPSSSNDRTNQYIIQKEREKYHLKFSNIDEYNNALKTHLSCEEATHEHMVRISELSSRTNQFNLSNTHLSVDEISSYISDQDYCVLILSAEDSFGDLGIIGCAVINLVERKILAFMISCRVFNRGFENYLLENIKSLFHGEKLYGVFKPNTYNNKFAEFYSKNNILTIED